MPQICDIQWWVLGDGGHVDWVLMEDSVVTEGSPMERDSVIPESQRPVQLSLGLAAFRCCIYEITFGILKI